MLQVEKLFQVAAHSGSIYSIISDSDEFVYTAGSEGVVLKWNIQTPDSAIAVAKVSGQIFHFIYFSPSINCGLAPCQARFMCWI